MPEAETVLPPFSFARVFERPIWLVLRATLPRTKLPDGSYPDWVRTLPNRITQIRWMTPVPVAGFVGTVMTQRPRLAALMLCFIVALQFTDALDGAVARFIKEESDWGRRWDPLIDKYTTAWLFGGWLWLASKFTPAPVFWILASLVAARASMDLALAMIARSEQRRGLQPKAGLWGKIKAGFDALAVLAGYIGALGFAIPGSVSLHHDGLSVMSGGAVLLFVACMFAPLSIREHWRNLRGADRS